MLALQRRQQIRFVTLEKPNAWVVFAFLVEQNGNETLIVSEPKIVRIIQKKTVFALPAPRAKNQTGFASVKSPYVSAFFSKETQNFSLFARPPTF